MQKCKNEMQKRNAKMSNANMQTLQMSPNSKNALKTYTWYIQYVAEEAKPKRSSKSK